MKSLNNKGFTLVELIIVMVLLGILAAVAVPRMSQSIMAGEEAAEQKFLSSLVSALEIQAADEFIRNSKKQYLDNPFDALDKTPQRDNNSGEGWWIENVSAWDECCGDYNDNYRRASVRIHHRRNDGNEFTWQYEATGPRTRNNNGNRYVEQGFYTLQGPGFDGQNY